MQEQEEGVRAGAQVNAGSEGEREGGERRNDRSRRCVGGRAETNAERCKKQGRKATAHERK